MKTTSDAASDEDLVSAALSDPARFEALFSRCYAPVRSYLGRRLPSGAADECASETFLRALAGLRSYDPARASVMSWLLGIATNLVREHFRHEQRWLASLEAASITSESQSPSAEEASRLPVDARIAAAIRRLSPGDRDVLLLWAWADQSYEQISAALAIPQGTVKSRLHRIRRELRDELGESGHLPEAEVSDG